MIALLLPFFSFGQAEMSLNVKGDTVETKKYRPEREPDVKIIHLQMAYGGHKIYNSKIARRAKGRYIEKVKLIYTDYPKGHNMDTLNMQRMLQLYLLLPDAFNNEGIEWEFVKQTGANKNTVYNFFHGIAVHYRNKPIWEYAENKKEYFEDVLEGKEEIKDSTILKVFDRNKEWDNMLIVSDFTGSMSPYIAELLLWYHLNADAKKDQRFVFFNDGDMKDTDEKVIGETGGIYYTKHSHIDSVLMTAVRTIDAGSGGDGPENDIEALIFGIKKFPKHKTVVLVADNGSSVRDFSLIRKLKRPVKVIICGGSGDINLQYLNLAYSTGGSLHTIEEDIVGLIDLKEGQEMKIGDTTFIIQNGEFKVKEDESEED